MNGWRRAGRRKRSVSGQSPANAPSSVNRNPRLACLRSLSHGRRSARIARAERSVMPTSIQRPILPAEINDIDEVQFTTDQIALVKELQQKVAPAIIAAGLFGSETGWSDALSLLAEH